MSDTEAPVAKEEGGETITIRVKDQVIAPKPLTPSLRELRPNE